MSEVAIDNSCPVYQDIGIVEAETGDNYLLLCNGYRCNARKAAGCLVKPLKGDRVLFVNSAYGSSYILSVLEQADETRQQIQFESNTEIACKGQLDISGFNGVKLSSSKNIGLIATGLEITADRGQCSFSQFQFFSDLFIGNISRLKLLARKVETVLNTLHQKIKRSYRDIEDIDHVKAGKVEYEAEKVMSLRGKYSIVTAREDIKIDGERIHMG